MLIIAMPKSASSALIATLCKLHGLEDRTRSIRNQYLLDLPIAEDFAVFLKQHGEMRELKASCISAFMASGGISKHHVPPSKNNQALLAPHKKVILLRDPEEVVIAYKRGEDTGVFPMRDLDYVWCITEEDWLNKARQRGLLDQMHLFYKGWEEHAGDKLIVRFQDLVEHPQEVIQTIERYWNLPVCEQVVLERKKYTRHPDAPDTLSGSRLSPLLAHRKFRILKKIVRDSLRFLGIWKPDYIRRYKNKLLEDQNP